MTITYLLTLFTYFVPSAGIALLILLSQFSSAIVRRKVKDSDIVYAI